MKALRNDDPLKMVTEWTRITDTEFKCKCCGQTAAPSALTFQHDTCDHILGTCEVFLGQVVTCEHGEVKVTCAQCFNTYLDVEARRAEMGLVDDE